MGISVRRDATKKHTKREGRYIMTRTLLNAPPSKKGSRLKGSKNQWKAKNSKKKKKRGRKGFFKIFDKGEKFDFIVDP